MLESTVWRQYHKDNNFREFLSKHSVLKIEDLIEDDKELYGVIKAKLTKKELKLFAMDSAEIADADLQKEFDYDDEALKKAKFKLYKKLKQDKTRLSFRINNSE
jgi:tRNA A22 N-methylase